MSKAEVAKQARAIVDTYFSEFADSDNCISAQQYADLVQLDAKTVRARLRKMKKRDQSQFKNATWRVTKAIAVDVYADRLVTLDEAS